MKGSVGLNILSSQHGQHILSAKYQLGFLYFFLPSDKLGVKRTFCKTRIFLGIPKIRSGFCWYSKSFPRPFSYLGFFVLPSLVRRCHLKSETDVRVYARYIRIQFFVCKVILAHFLEPDYSGINYLTGLREKTRCEGKGGGGERPPREKGEEKESILIPRSFFSGNNSSVGNETNRARVTLLQLWSF